MPEAKESNVLDEGRNEALRRRYERRKAWNDLIYTITQTARSEQKTRGMAGQTCQDLEDFFEIGPAGKRSGNTWGRWLNDPTPPLPRSPDVRRSIIDRAFEAGWLKPDQQELPRLGQLVEAAIYGWVDELEAPLCDPPDPPLGRVTRATSARLVARALVCDGEGKLAPRLVRAIKIWEKSIGRAEARPSQMESQSDYAKGIRQNLEDAARWKDAARAVKSLIADGRHADILEEQLVAAYIRKGYN